ncbi:glycoside hydrolase family 172 protein, partial [Bacteroidota bacterium]
MKYCIKNSGIAFIILPVLLYIGCNDHNGNGENHNASTNFSELYKHPGPVKSRWISFENPDGTKGKGGTENKGAKGHPYHWIEAGESITLMNITGAGIIHRIWITISDRSPEMLRSLKLEMYWDNSDEPAVSTPFGDFFGVGLGKRVKFESALFSDPEGRSFNCSIPMPFRSAARVIVVNEAEIPLDMLFYDINYSLNVTHDDDVMYFHAYWNRQNPTDLGVDYEILPKVTGRGRFLGTNIGVIDNPDYKGYWWGEGEVKAYLDGDTDLPTLVGTGTEDYIGSAWGQGIFNNMYQGCLIAGEKNQWAFYRYHVNDPVVFNTDCRVTIQQMGGSQGKNVAALMDEGIPLIPVTKNSTRKEMLKFLEMDAPPDLHA